MHTERQSIMKNDKNSRWRLAVSPETTSVNLTLCHPLPNPVCVLPVSCYCWSITPNWMYNIWKLLLYWVLLDYHSLWPQGYVTQRKLWDMYDPSPNFFKQYILCPLPLKKLLKWERHGKISPYSVKFWNSDKLIKDNLLKMPITIKGKQCWKSTHNFPPIMWNWSGIWFVWVTNKC